ncbi:MULTISPECIES: hypothetical protein [unclassified Microcoleus]|uniref:hypothetical protein n=1 Tax=unclassified Microcoleus TaxID=2642155 RepID=UPI002FD3BB39
MSRYILDTDCFSLWRKNHPMMVQRIEVNAENLAVTIVTLEEVIRGWFNVIKQASEPSQADKLVWAYTKLWDTLDDFKNLSILKFDQNAFNIYLMSDLSPIIQLPGRVCEIVYFWQILLVNPPLQESG